MGSSRRRSRTRCPERRTRRLARHTQWTTRARELADDWRATVARVTNTTSARPCPAARSGCDRRGAALGRKLDHAGTLSYARRVPCPPTCRSCGARARRAAITSNTAYSCMGYEVAGGLGAKLARPDSEVIVIVGDGQLPDDEQRTRHFGDAGREADHRAARQPRLWLHQSPAAGVRRRAVQQPDRRLRARPGRRASTSTSPCTRVRWGRRPSTSRMSTSSKGRCIEHAPPRAAT